MPPQTRKLQNNLQTPPVSASQSGVHRYVYVWVLLSGSLLCSLIYIPPKFLCFCCWNNQHFLPTMTPHICCLSYSCLRIHRQVTWNTLLFQLNTTFSHMTWTYWACMSILVNVRKKLSLLFLLAGFSEMLPSCCVHRASQMNEHDVFKWERTINSVHLSQGQNKLSDAGCCVPIIFIISGCI